jgi:hypothetical protein
MMDEELRKVLRQWEAPRPGATLDRRVFKSIHSQRRWWLRVAAGILLLAGLFAHLSQRPPGVVKADTQVVSVAVLADATGFEPLPEGRITVTKGTQ